MHRMNINRKITCISICYYMLVHTRDGTQVTVVMMLLLLIVIGHGYAMVSKSIYGHKLDCCTLYS